MVKKLIIITGFLLLPFASICQNIIAYATLSTNEAYIGQPVRLTISVYTSTWFTAGIDLGNIKIDDALTVSFRSVSNSKTFSGKKYAGVSFYYNVFPTKDGKITIPSLSINIESPKPGDYKGLKRTVKTKPKYLNVLPIPLGYDPNKWLVATYLSVTQKWSMPLNNIKVGDVLQRTINRSAGGTLSEFIPTTIYDSISGVSLYPRRAKVNTNKSKTAISSSRSETINYLFEKEGDVILPSMEYIYYNAGNKKFYKKRIDSVFIQVKPNPDLSMLASIKKSLQKDSIETAEIEEKPFLIFGVTPKIFIKYMIIGLATLLVLIYLIKHLVAYIKHKHRSYLQSESFAFNQVKKALKDKDYFAFTGTSHVWLKKLNPEFESLQDLAKYTNSNVLQQALEQVTHSIFNKEKTQDTVFYSKLLHAITETRNSYLKHQSHKTKSVIKSNIWLNPTSKS